ncbi:SPRY-domain-containing protein [Cystobasidium minutum MCA 4210]|uniref:SPRY-domain-containing protein n=1 Tax=Cystobasidium minutum MCA 4210 TaxID=1397322 RepID=UPI0034CD596C|eukprot:jgi/Rhomi1/143788/e_gw1.4.573.1
MPSTLDDNDASSVRAGSRGAASNRISAGASLLPSSILTTTTTTRDPSLALLLPLLILLSTLLFLLLFFLVFLIVVRRRRSRGIALQDYEGPLDLSREEEFEGEGGIAGVEERWLEQQDEAVQRGYERAKLWQQQYLPNSMSTDITLSQFLSIQEKGVSAWSFEPDYESNSGAIVTSRTEITFLNDGIGMTPQEGGACCVQSNLPLPRLNEVYYWECKFFEKPEETNVAVGLTTKPYPSFRMPGWNRYSVGYHSADGFKSHNYPFTAQSYGPPLAEGDVLGVGYRPRTGAVFFTRNGKKLEDAYIGLTKHNLFPTVAADGAATIHVNLGQAGFVFIEANVKKWGLAPMIGTLAPPPAYGSEGGSILLETATGPQVPSGPYQSPPHTSIVIDPAPAATTSSTSSSSTLAVAALQQPPDQSEHSSSRSSRHRRGISNSTAPIRPSPLRTSMTRQRTSSYTSSSASSPVSIRGNNGHSSASPPPTTNDDLPHNPPTPGRLDISLRAMSPFSRRAELEAREEAQRQNGDASPSYNTAPPTSSTPPYHLSTQIPSTRLPGDVSPPSYQLIDSNQYPAGVAEAMLEAMPEDQFNALFAQAAAAHQNNSSSNQNSARWTSMLRPQNIPGASGQGDHGPSSSSSSVTLRNYESRATQQQPQHGDVENQYAQDGQQSATTGLGLRGFFGSIWGGASSDQQQQH